MKITKKINKKTPGKISKDKALRGFIGFSCLLISLHACASEEPAKQPKPSETTSPRFDLPAQGTIQTIGFTVNSIITFQLTSNVAWGVTGNQTWCSVSPAKGAGTNTAVTITVKATQSNPSATSTRNCTLTFTAEGVSSNPTRSVTQIRSTGNVPPNKQARLALPVQDTIPKIGSAINSRITFPLTSNVAWSIAKDQSWCSVSPASGVAKNTAITITVTASAANTGTSTRSCTLTFIATGVSSRPTRSVTQNGTPPRLALPVQGAIPTIGFAINSRITFPLTSNVAWSIAKDQSWCSVSPASGVAKNTAVTITVTASAANTSTSSARDCTLTFTAKGVSSSPTRRVTQSPSPLVYTVGSVRFLMRRVPAKESFFGLSACTSACITRDFYMAETEVTYQLWNAVHTWATASGSETCQTSGEACYTFDNAGVRGSTASGTTTDNLHPVTTVNWYDAIKFSNALTEYYNATNGASTDLTLVYGTSAQQGTIRTTTGIRHGSTTHILNTVTPKATATGFRLPSEEEWELAARFINDINNDGDIMDANEYYHPNYASGATANYTDVTATKAVAWYSGNSGGTTHTVKGKRANALGLYDMSGNVWEWSFNWYAVNTRRARRGGSWSNDASNSQVGRRGSNNPDFENSRLGFRLAR